MLLTDKFFIKVFSDIPVLSPNRYSGLSHLAKALKSLSQEKPNILDIGGGSSITSKFLSEIGLKGKYLGIDLKFKDQSQGTQKLHRDFSATFQKIDFFKFKSTKKYDLILSLWNLEHLKNDQLALKKMRHLLTKRGFILLIIPTFWTWPIEFGRHGYHYYTTSRIKKIAKQTSLKISKIGPIGGFMGWLYTIIYQWTSYLVLVPVLMLIQLIGKLPKRHTREDVGNAELSRKILSNSIFAYKRTMLGKKIHFKLIKLICKADNYLPFTPLSYLIILAK